MTDAATLGTRERVGAGPVISIRKLVKTFRAWRWARRGRLKLPMWGPARVDAVKGIDLEVQPGEIFGFLGPNGAGKTTTIKMLMGLIRPSSGEMHIFGGSPDELSTRARIGFLPEQPYFYDYLTPVEILDFYARLFRTPKAERRERIDGLLNLVGLAEARDRRLRTFSKGMLQRVGIASALVNEPDLIVLDEPLSGLDPIGRKEMRDVIVGLRDRGRTVFFSSHILSDAELICDKVAIIDRGVLRSVGALGELLDRERVSVEIVVQGLADVGTAAVESLTATVERIGRYHRLTVHESEVDAVLRAVLDAGGRIETVLRKRESLEDLFLRAAVRS